MQQTYCQKIQQQQKLCFMQQVFNERAQRSEKYDILGWGEQYSTAFLAQMIPFNCRQLELEVEVGNLIEWGKSHKRDVEASAASKALPLRTVQVLAIFLN